MLCGTVQAIYKIGTTQSLTLVANANLVGYAVIGSSNVDGTSCPSGSFAMLTGPEVTAIQSASGGAGPYVATADDYAAVSLIFGAILTAACLIWGSKQLYNLLRNRPES